MTAINKPLSKLVAGQDLPVLNIESYVHRSDGERKYEVQKGKTPGRIKRPLNAFMLYRRVYQKVVEDYYNINDHCLVSQLCGASWGLEPEYIRRMYTDWADVERANHAKTWPEYKFSPKRRRE
jgi:hypothetical protein